MKKQMQEELKAQMQMNQRLLQENNTSFKERVKNDLAKSVTKNTLFSKFKILNKI